MGFTNILGRLIYVICLILIISVLCEQQNPTCGTGAVMNAISHIDWPENDTFHITSVNQTTCANLCLQNCSCTVAIYANLSSGDCWFKAMPLGKSVQDGTRIALVKVNDAVPTMPTKVKKEGRGVMVIGIILVVCSLAFAASLILIWFCKYQPKIRRVLYENHSVNPVGMRAFSYKEMEAATRGFTVEIGRGAFGIVYKGTLSDGRAIAAKKLDNRLSKGEQQDVENEFRREMGIIGVSHHKNLVQLYGFCCEDSHKILVYECMPNGSLDRVLFKSANNPDWERRFQIALGTAKGILYLHEEVINPILHCDIKPQNILLDENYNAKIADFGISKLIGVEQTRTFTVARGTVGYIAPEWLKSMAVTVKVDVYSFGVVLMEIICCRNMFDLRVPEDEMVLSDWVYNCLKCGKLLNLMEEQDCRGIEKTQLERMVLVGLWCIQEDPILRPSMKKVVQMLEGTIEIQVPPHPSSS